MNKPSTILVIYNRVTKSQGDAKEILADEDNVTTANEVSDALGQIGFSATTFDVNEKTINEIPQKKFDLVFNLSEGMGDVPKSDFLVARFLENHQIPFTGSGSETLALTNNKINTKSLLLKHNLPTPKFTFLNSSSDPLPSWINFPVIVKPVGMDCSIGIDQNSVVENSSSLKKVLDEKEEKYQDLFFVEEYIDGREINVAILGNGDNLECLPPSEIIFDEKHYPGKYKIVDYDAKWVEFSKSYQSTPPVCPAILDEKAKQELFAIAKKAYQLTNCHDYGRVDFRLGKDGVPYVLEVNANQGISEDTGTTRSANAAGYTYESFLQKIIDLATERLLS